MIWESKYWKKDLLMFANNLEKRKKQRKWFDSSNANTEKEIMISSFIVRKLFESQKNDNEIQKKKIPIVKYLPNGKKIDISKRLSPERYFNIEKPVKSSISLKNLYNNIIHSYIFILYFVDKEFKYFWVASDFNKFKFMLQIDITSYIEVLREVGNYWPNQMSYFFDDKIQDYIVVMNNEKILEYLTKLKST